MGLDMIRKASRNAACAAAAVAGATANAAYDVDILCAAGVASVSRSQTRK